MYIRDALGAAARSYLNSDATLETARVTADSSVQPGDAGSAAAFVASSVDALLQGAKEQGNIGAVVSNAAVMTVTLQGSLDKCAGVACGPFGVCVYGACVCQDGYGGPACVLGAGAGDDQSTGSSSGSSSSGPDGNVTAPRILSVTHARAVVDSSCSSPSPNSGGAASGLGGGRRRRVADLPSSGLGLQLCPGSSVGVYVGGAVAHQRLPKVECSGHGVCHRTRPALAELCWCVGVWLRACVLLRGGGGGYVGLAWCIALFPRPHCVLCSFVWIGAPLCPYVCPFQDWGRVLLCAV